MKYKIKTGFHQQPTSIHNITSLLYEGIEYVEITKIDEMFFGEYKLLNIEQQDDKIICNVKINNYCGINTYTIQFICDSCVKFCVDKLFDYQSTCYNKLSIQICKDILQDVVDYINGFVMTKKALSHLNGSLD